MLESDGTASGELKLFDHAARSRAGSSGFAVIVFQPSTLRSVIYPEAIKAQNSVAAVSAEGSAVCVLMRRLNSSCRRSIAFVVLMLSPEISVRPEGAYHQWKKDPPR